MAKDCWCPFKFHLPGEKKRHAKAKNNAKAMMQILDSGARRTN